MWTRNCKSSGSVEGSELAHVVGSRRESNLYFKISIHVSWRYVGSDALLARAFASEAVDWGLIPS